MKKILLCSDLDRTLIPNGKQVESAQARALFASLSAHEEICLAYVTGRNAFLVKESIGKYSLPGPDFVIGDVGTTLYRIMDKQWSGQWHLEKKWQQEIGRDWQNCNRDGVVGLLADLQGMGLRLQEEEKQNKYKISYYTAPDLRIKSVQDTVSTRLAEHGIHSTVVWSRDDAKQCGLLDILPPRANKLQAIRFLMQEEKIPETNTVFAGDSGNDLDVLTSGLQAILVRNSADDVRKAALHELTGKGCVDSLYIARGGLYGMNGNYAAGVLEGLVHFFPETAGWISGSR